MYPAMSVAAPFVTGGHDRARQPGSLFESHGGRSERAAERVPREQAHHPRRPGIYSVEVVRLVGVVADRNLGRDPQLIDRLGSLVAGGDDLLRALFDLYDERHREAPGFGSGGAGGLA